MKLSNLETATDFAESRPPAVYKQWMADLLSFDLLQSASRENIYSLSRTLLTPQDVAQRLLDNHLVPRQGERTDNFLRELIRGVSSADDSATERIDFKLQLGDTLYMIVLSTAVAQDPKTSARMLRRFQQSRKTHPRSSRGFDIVFVEGCCFGTGENKEQMGHSRLCGDTFWSLISHIPDLYSQVVEPIGHKLSNLNTMFRDEYMQVVNIHTSGVCRNYVTNDGGFGWDKLSASLKDRL